MTVENKEDLNEFKTSAGNGAEVADPIAKGDAHKNRSADKKGGAEPMPKLPGSKVEVINYVLKQLVSGSKDDAFAAFKSLEAQWNSRSQSGNEKNASTITTKEDVETIFAGTELSEEFKEQAHVLFEAAVNVRVATREAELQEEYETRLEEAVEGATKVLADKVDAYLDYVAEEWLKANALQVEKGLRSEVAESFLAGLKTLFEEHYVDIPEDKVDVVESLSDRVAELEAKLNESIDNTITLKKKLDESARERALDKLSEGLTETQKEKFATLVEGLEADDADEFTGKAKIIRESHFVKESKKVLTEDNLKGGEPLAVSETPKIVDPEIARIADAISRTAKR